MHRRSSAQIPLPAPPLQRCKTRIRVPPMSARRHRCSSPRATDLPSGPCSCLSVPPTASSRSVLPSYGHRACDSVPAPSRHQYTTTPTPPASPGQATSPRSGSTASPPPRPPVPSCLPTLPIPHSPFPILVFASSCLPLLLSSPPLCPPRPLRSTSSLCLCSSVLNSPLLPSEFLRSPLIPLRSAFLFHG